MLSNDSSTSEKNKLPNDSSISVKNKLKVTTVEKTILTCDNSRKNNSDL